MTFKELKTAAEFSALLRQNPDNALALAYLAPEEAAKIINGIPADLRADAVRRIAEADLSNLGSLAEAAALLENLFPAEAVGNSEPAGGPKCAANILKNAGRETEAAVLQALEEAAPATAKSIKERLFDFEELAFLDDRSVQKALREIDAFELAMSLKNSSAAVQEKIYCNMSVRAAKMLREDIEFMGPVRAKDVEEAQAKICAVVRSLEDSGEIVVVRKGEAREIQKESPQISTNRVAAIAEHGLLSLPEKTVEEIIDALESGDLPLPEKYRKKREQEQLEENESANSNAPVPDHELNPEEFEAIYYQTVKAVVYYSEKARREGLLALEEEIKDIDDEFFQFGLFLVIDGTEKAAVREMLSLRIEQECRYYNRLVKMVQREGLLDIQAGELPRTIMFRLSSLADIPGNKISQLIAAGDFDVSGIECAVPEVRMEEAFIMRAISIAGKARNEGLLAIEEDIDRSAPDDVFEAGLLLVTDGVKRETIAEILDNLVEKETNPWKKKFARAKRDAVLLILAGDSPRMVEVRLTSYFDNYVRGNIEKAVLKD